MSNYMTPFTHDELVHANALVQRLAVSLQGRKLEEGDWTEVYCRVKGAPIPGWSNLPFRDYIHNGVGVEFKLLCRPNPIGDVGRALMHPSATRTISFDESEPAETAKLKVLSQWAAQIEQFEHRIAATSTTRQVDARWGVLLWSPDHRQFLYFEEKLDKPDPNNFTARWHDGRHRGNATRNLHIFDRVTGRKKFSCTLPRNGAKLQPYFTVPTVAQGAVLFELEQSDQVPLYITRALRERLSIDFPNHTDDEIIQELVASFHREMRT